MNCVKCGKVLPDGSAFCAYCGAPQGGAAAPEMQPVSKMQPVSEMQLAFKMQPAPEMQPNPEKKRKRFLLPLIIGIAAVVVIAVVVGVVFLFGSDFFGSSGGSEKELVYMSNDGEIFYVKNMDSDKAPISVCEVEGAEYGNNIYLSSDGKYLYYMDDLKGDGSGDLYRAELGKLKADSKKNDQYIVEIDSNVMCYQVFGDDQQVIYSKIDGTLIYFNGEDDEDIAENVSYYDWNLDASGEYVIYERRNDGTDIFGYDLASGDTVTIAERVEFMENGLENKDFIVYMTEDDEYVNDLYYSGVNGKSKKIASDVKYTYGCNAEEKSLYYLVEYEEERNLYDFFVDDSASMEIMEEPQIKNFLQPATEQDAMTDFDITYYEMFPEELGNFYEGLSFDDESGMRYTHNYSDNNFYLYDEQTQQWFLLDAEAYNEAYEKYEDLGYRSQMLESLKDEKIYEEYYDLYYWKAGEEAVLVAENIDCNSITTDEAGLLVFYRKLAATADTGIPLSRIESYYDAWEYYEEAQDGREVDDTQYYYNGSEEAELDGIVYDDDIAVSESKDQMVLLLETEEGGMLACYAFKNGVLSDRKEITDDAAYGGAWNGDSFYYFEDVFDSNGDLYQYKDGESECILKDVWIYDVRIYEDGTYTGYRDFYDGGELCIYNSNGDDRKIGKNIHTYTYINEDRILYMKDNSLYVYNGKKDDTRVAKKVDNYICHGMAFDWIR